MKKLFLYFIFTSLSVVYGQDVINVGTSANDHTGDPLRTAFQKVNTNFASVYDSLANIYTEAQIDSLLVDYYLKTQITTLLAGKQDTGVVSMTYPGAGIPLSTGSAWGTSITNSSTNWNTAYTDRLKWDGGATGLTAATGRTSLGGTTVGQALFTLANPTAIRVPLINADNTVTATATTGTGDIVRASSPTLVTPALGTPSAIVLTNASGTAASLTAGAVTGYTPASGSLTLSGADAITLTTTGVTGVTLPTSGILAITQDITDSIEAAMTRDIDIGDKSFLTTGLVGSSVSAVGQGYFEELTVTNPLKARINSDSIIWADGALLPSMSLNIKDLEILGSTVKAMTLGMSIGETKASVTMVDNSMKVIPVYLRTPQVITGVKIGMTTQGVYTADNYNGVGLYKYNATLDSLELVASSTDDGDIWKASSGAMITKAFSSAYNADAGLYYVTCLYNNSAQTTAPVVYGTSPGIWIGGLLSSGYFVAGSEAGQNTFPAIYKASDINTSSSSYLLFLY